MCRPTFTRKSDLPRSTRIQNILDAGRFTVALMRKPPIQPLLAALAISFALGAVPMTMTAIYSLVRTVADWYHQHLKHLEFS
jgi:hypothetical protein